MSKEQTPKEYRNNIHYWNEEVMSKEKTPITAEEFCKNLDNEIGEAWSNDYEDLPKYMEQYAQAKVLEALEIVKKEIEGIGYTDTKTFDWICEIIETEVKPKYNGFS